MRRATLRDAEEIAQLHIRSWQATYVSELPPDFLAGQDLASRTAWWQYRIEQGMQVLVAEEDRVVIGFVACGPAHDAESLRNNEWEIHNLHVDPSRHGQGIGSALLDSAVQLGLEHGAMGLTLWVVRTNAAARAFYERRGMRHDGGEQQHGVAPGLFFHEVRYKMRLRGAHDSPRPLDARPDDGAR